MIYLHVPFCRSFCTYCDFYSEIACRERDGQQFEAFAAAVCAEAALRRDEIDATRGLDTLYIGGGTPSVLPLPYLQRIVDAVSGATRPAAESSRRADGNYFSDRFAEKPISAPLSAAGVIIGCFRLTANEECPADLCQSGIPKSGSGLLSHLVGQYHRRWRV